MPSSWEIERAVRAAGLNRTEAAIFAYAAFWAPKGRWKEGWTYTTRPEVADAIGVSERTVDRALTKLATEGLLEHRTGYHEDRRRRVTLLRPSKCGDELLKTIALNQGDRARVRRSINPRNGDTNRCGKADRTLAQRQDQCRQDGSSHLTSVPAEVSLPVASSIASGEKKKTSPVENSTGEENFVNTTNKILNEKNLPRWKMDKWVVDRSGECLSELATMEVELPDWFEGFSCLLDNWKKVLQQLPRSYAAFEDNQERPSPKCVADQVRTLVQIIRDWRTAMERDRRSEERRKKEELRLLADVKRAVEHLSHGGWYTDFPGTLADGAWTEAHNELQHDPEYRKRYEVHEAKMQSDQTVKRLYRMLLSGSWQAALNETENSKELKLAIRFWAAGWTENFSEGWEHDGDISFVAKVLDQHGIAKDPIPDAEFDNYAFLWPGLRN